MKSLCLFLFSILLFTPLNGQTVIKLGPPSEEEIEIRNRIRSEINLENINYQGTISKIYSGNFIEIRIDKDDLAFENLLNSYMVNFATECSDYLPENKKEITYKECIEYRERRNGYGRVISTVCTKYNTVHTGLFAAPKVFYASRIVESNRRRNLGKLAAESIRNLSPDAILSNQKNEEKSYNDMQNLIKNNGCNSKALKRFEKNLLRYADGLPGIGLDEN